MTPSPEAPGERCPDCGGRLCPHPEYGVVCEEPDCDYAPSPVPGSGGGERCPRCGVDHLDCSEYIPPSDADWPGVPGQDKDARIMVRAGDSLLTVPTSKIEADIADGVAGFWDDEAMDSDPPFTPEDVARTVVEVLFADKDGPIPVSTGPRADESGPSEEDYRLASYYNSREQGDTPGCDCASVGMLDGNRHNYGCPYNRRWRLAWARVKEAAEPEDMVPVSTSLEDQDARHPAAPVGEDQDGRVEGEEDECSRADLEHELRRLNGIVKSRTAELDALKVRIEALADQLADDMEAEISADIRSLLSPVSDEQEER